VKGEVGRMGCDSILAKAYSVGDALATPIGGGVVKPSIEELEQRIERLRKILLNDLQTSSLPSEGFTLQRLLAPNIIERSDQFYLLSLDYNLLAVKA